jgi:hypothetical protein
VAIGKALEYFDTDGSHIETGGVKWFFKGQLPTTYQTPYSPVEVACHVYQRSEKGQYVCPLERDARIVVTSTPRFAKVVAHQFAKGVLTTVQRDLAENHGRDYARSYLQGFCNGVNIKGCRLTSVSMIRWLARLERNPCCLDRSMARSAQPVPLHLIPSP